MASFLVFIAGLVLAAAIFFTGGWILRGLWDRYQAEAARDAQVDACLKCGTAGCLEDKASGW